MPYWFWSVSRSALFALAAFASACAPVAPLQVEDVPTFDIASDRPRPVADVVAADVVLPPFIADPAPPECTGDASACRMRTNTVAYCVMGQCRYACTGSFADCNAQPADGCELDTAISADHCGRCGNSCPAAVNSTARCVMGTCGLMCSSGFADCDRMPDNGCEADIQRNASTCGTCGTSCPAGANATPQCSSGACGLVCNMGFGNCDMNNVNGCEQDLRADTNNCGACRTRCVGGANSTEQCVMGACSLRCAMGFGNCDMNSANGCETALTSDVSNCGRCGERCVAPSNATPTCTAGACGSSCIAGFVDCDMNNANGCEVDTRTSLANCGACGRVCASTIPGTVPVCMAGMCRAQCATGFADCDSNMANGCEVDISASPLNCGVCGSACPVPPNAAATCASSRCGFRCAMGFSNCDGNSANGCETARPSCL